MVEIINRITLEDDRLRSDLQRDDLDTEINLDEDDGRNDLNGDINSRSFNESTSDKDSTDVNGEKVDMYYANYF